MGFCRRCGEIVNGTKCKCGGTAVAPVVQWNPGQKNPLPDRWQRIYVAKEPTPPPAINPHKAPVENKPVAIKPAAAAEPNNTTTGRRFPRPLSTSSSKIAASVNRFSGITSHINSTTSPVERPSSPLKNQIVPSSDPSILPSPASGTLAKAYGSVLQSPKSRASYSCSSCSTPFPPDATIYPSPSAPNPNQFVCRSCFTSQGGTKGTCEACGKDVLKLKIEGAWVENGGKVWHAKCFECHLCGKDISAEALVDLFGQPCCEDCFDKSVGGTKPLPSTSPKPSSAPNKGRTSNPGGMRARTVSRESSPIFDELSRRLGIDTTPKNTSGNTSSPLANKDATTGATGGAVKVEPLRLSARREFSPFMSPDPSPSITRITKATSGLDLRSSIRSRSPTRSPSPTLRKQLSSSGIRVSDSSSSMTPSLSSSPSAASFSSSMSKVSAPSTSTSFSVNSSASNSPPDKLSESTSSKPQPSAIPFRVPSGGLHSRIPSQSTGNNKSKKPDLISPTPSPPGTRIPRFRNVSKSLSISTPMTTPPRASIPDPHNNDTVRGRPTTRIPSLTIPKPVVDTSATCKFCHKPLYSRDGSGRVVSIPAEKATSTTVNYHYDCFKCHVCERPFSDSERDGKTSFVREDGAPVHIECASPRKIISIAYPLPPTSLPPTTPPRKPRPDSKLSSSPSPRIASPSACLPPSNPSPPPSAVSQSGRFTCGGCSKTVFQMERGVVAGPQGSRWHVACLVCGGKDWKKNIDITGERHGPGCGKKLDSQARLDRTGAVWCRECLVLLSPSNRGNISPTRVPLTPSYTGATSFAFPKVESGRFVNGSFAAGGGEIRRSPSPLRMQFTGARSGSGLSPVRRQMTGLGSMLPPSLSPVKTQFTGGGAALVRQVTGNGVPITRQRPKSVLGNRSIGNASEGRGMFLVRQMTGTTDV